MEASYGFIETRGFVAAVTAADAMVKAADVQLLKFRKVGGALITIVVKGNLAACQAAVEAGAKAAQAIGLLVSSHIIANPYPDTQNQVENMPKGRGGRKGQKRTVRQRPQQPPAKVTDSEIVLNFLKKRKRGATLMEIAAVLQKTPAETRVVIKQLMDQNKIEKIRQMYFLNS